MFPRVTIAEAAFPNYYYKHGSFSFLAVCLCPFAQGLTFMSCQTPTSPLQVKQLDVLTEEVKGNWCDSGIIDRM